MIVVGAKGLAKELLEVFFQRSALDNLYFFDDVSQDVPEKMFNQFSIIRSLQQVQDIFSKTGDYSFCLGLGNPVLRYRLCERFLAVGGTVTSVVSSKADIGNFDTFVASGCCILSGAVITSNVRIGKGCLVNPNVTISHDAELGDFVEVSPGVNITGNCRIGAFSFLGSNSVILPKVEIGTNVTIGAGAVVTKDVPDNCVVAGVPAVIKRTLPPLSF